MDYSRMTEDQIKLVNYYCENNMNELKKICHYIWSQKNIPNFRHDDLYSDAMNVLAESALRYDKKKNVKFKTYLTQNISKSFKDWYRDNFLRAKRNNLELDEKGNIKRDEKGNPIIISNVSFDVSTDDGIDLREKIASSFVIEENLDNEEMINKNTISYLKSLSPTQIEIARLIMKGYETFDIKQKLHLSDKQYDNHIRHMRCFEKASILKREEVSTYTETEEKIMSNNQTFEKSKTEKYSIASIIKKMNNRTLRYDHPLQRESDQHSTKMKSNLMSDILQGNPIPALVFAEQVINGISITWNLDGKQRSTNVKEFTEDKFKISKSVRRSLIKYQAIIKDENGEIIPDDNGFPQAEWREFDITNKKFSQLPVELQEKFMDYCFDVTLYMNCSDEDIAYHIERYNDGKQMASSQKGIVKLGEDYARMIKGISAMPFFSENGFNYTQKKNGAVDRVCIESVMATEFLEDWKTSPEDIATFLKKNAKEEHFDNLEDTVERLENVITNDIGTMFDVNDSFIYFSVFARFKKLGLEDGKFIEFMTEYAQSLHNMMKETEIDSETGKKKSTKDKVVVMDKINLVEKLMNDFLHINEEDLQDVDILNFVRENVNSETIESDIELYSDILDDLTIEVDNDTKLLEEHNRPSLIALIAYACDNDIDDKLKEWFTWFFNTNDTYDRNTKNNYTYMLNSLMKFQNDSKQLLNVV